MALIEDLKDLGVNVDEGVNRLMGNAALYEKMLGTFVKMMENSSVDPDFDGENYEGVIETAHAIKGASGNLSITPVYEAYTKIVDLLRGGQPEPARELLVEIIPVQKEIVECIKKYKG